MGQSAKITEPYFLISGRSWTWITARVIRPRLPSLPNSAFCSSILELAGGGVALLSVPAGVTRVMFSTRSSMLRLRFFFMPLAFVASATQRGQLDAVRLVAAGEPFLAG